MTKIEYNTTQHNKLQRWANKSLRKPQDKSRVDKLETMVTLGAQSTGRRQTKPKKQHIFTEQLYYFLHDALHTSEHQHFNLNRHAYVNIDNS